MARKIRSDSTVGSAEKRLGFKLFNPGGRNTRSDKKIGTIRKEQKSGK